MKQEHFEKRYEVLWETFEVEVDSLEKSKWRSVHVSEAFSDMFRQLCNHLAIARNRQYSPVLVDRLNLLVMRGHQRLYAGKKLDPRAIATFFARDFPRAVRAEWRLFGLCWLLFFGTGFGVAYLVVNHPPLIYSFMDAEEVQTFEKMYNPEDADSRTSGVDVYMFGYYIWNNIGIGLRTFAGGLFAGVGSFFILIVNGLLLGAVTGHIIVRGYGDTFFPFVVGHGAFELTAIVIAGMAGVMLGRALVFPGRNSRREALRLAGEKALPLVYGMVFMLLLAAGVEAFWSPRQTDPQTRYLVGALLWVLTYAYLALAGRPHEA